MAENHHPAPEPPARGLIAFALLVLLAVGFYWKLTLSRQFHWFDHPDMAYLEIPRLAFQAREIQQGRFPLWDPHLWAGQPLIGQTQPGPLFPLNLLFALLPLRDGYLKFHLLNWYWAAIHLLGAFFFYLWSRDLRLSRTAAVFAGCTFGFAGFVGSVAWLDVVNGAIWAPLIFLFLFRALRGGPCEGANAALGGMFLGISWLSGHHECPILLSLASGGTWLWSFTENWRRVRAAAIFVAVSGLVSAVQLLPTLEFGRLSARWVGLDRALEWYEKIPYTVQSLYSLRPKELWGLVIANGAMIADTSLFVGVVALALAAYGLWRHPRQMAVRWATGCGVLSTIYALGEHTPLNGILYSLVPVLDKARIPSRATFLLSVAIALLAGFGLDAVLSDPKSARLSRLRTSLAAGGTLLVGILLAISLNEKETPDGAHVAAYTALAIAVIIAAWQSSNLRSTFVAGALLGLALIEWSNAGPARYSNVNNSKANSFLNSLTQHQDIARYLRSQPGPVRVIVDEQSIGANFGDWHGIDMMQGYVAGVNRGILDHEFHTARTQRLFGVTHYLGKQPDQPGQLDVFTGTDGLKLFASPDPLPRARIVHDAQTVESFDWMRIKIQDPEIDLSQVALFLNRAPKLEKCTGQERVRILRRTTDEAVFETELACRGLLIYSENMYPGWEASVEGRPVPVLAAYGTLRAVVLERGSHLVTMRFRPRSVYFGAALTLCGVLLTALLVYLDRRRQ